MKLLDELILLIIVTIIGCIVGSMIFYAFQEKPIKLKPNQIWRYTINEDNPYEQLVNVDSKIINVKNGYVQYINMQNNDTLSSKESTFRFDSKCITNCE